MKPLACIPLDGIPRITSPSAKFWPSIGFRFSRIPTAVPEISKAYYGKLEGDPHYYIINSENDFLFYTSIMN